MVFMSQISFHPLTWQELHAKTFLLAKKIKASQEKFDRLVAINRGGAVITRILSDFLKLPTSGFTMVSYGGINEAEEPKVAEELKVDLAGERILLVDEITDSGRTFEVALEYLTQLKAAEIKTLAPFIKPKTSFKPDFWQVETEDWVIFPYEVRETIEDVQAMLRQQDQVESEQAESEVEAILDGFGFSAEMLAEFK